MIVILESIRENKFLPDIHFYFSVICNQSLLRIRSVIIIRKHMKHIRFLSINNQNGMEYNIVNGNIKSWLNLFS